MKSSLLNKGLVFPTSTRSRCTPRHASWAPRAAAGSDNGKGGPRFALLEALLTSDERCLAALYLAIYRLLLAKRFNICFASTFLPHIKHLILFAAVLVQGGIGRI